MRSARSFKKNFCTTNKNFIKPTVISNVHCPTLDSPKNTVQRPCTPRELITNGGFEQGGVIGPFFGWQVTENNISIFSGGIAYEGLRSAQFETLPTPQLETKLASLRQNVIVPPGCFLVLSFADNFLSAVPSPNFLDLSIRASVSHAGADLILIEIDYLSSQAGQGYVFHQRAADNPVPFNVSSVTVQFDVEIRDVIGTVWLLDGVSLRAV